MTLINAKVAATLNRIVSFDSSQNDLALVVLAAMFSIVIWAVAAWYFGIPTSESHADSGRNRRRNCFGRLFRR